MVVPVGTLVNAGAVALGGCLGMMAGRIIGDRLRDSLFQTMGLCVVLIGLKMAIQTGQLMAVLLSCVLGVVVGEALNLPERLAGAGDAAKRLLKSKNEKFTDGLVNTTLIVCVGAMAIVGSLEEGLGGSPATLLSKSILDFFAAMMLGSVYGSGVVAAAVPLLIYQGGITLLAGVAAPALTGPVRDVLIPTGGLMIVAIGCNLLGLKRIAVESLLPALVFAVIFGSFL